MSATKGSEILIVEDSPTQREKLEHILAERGYAVVTAANGAEALALARKHKPALIVSDVLMPGLDGYALCKAIRADDELKDIPIVLLTSLSSAEDIVRGLECGADNFIRKPFDERYLLTRVEAILLSRAFRAERKLQMGVELQLGGVRYFVTAERQQILDLLISTCEEVIHVNEQLKAVNEELETFSYSVSHDLRAPLRRIEGFAQAVLEEHASGLDEMGRNYLHRVQAATRQMAELIEDLLRLARVSQAEMHFERVDLSALFRDTAGELARGQPERHANFVIPDGLTVQGDERLLRVVVENLLGNAWKFTRNRAVAMIELGVADRGGRQTFVVRDNGAGFDMRFVGKLFAPFQRLHTEVEFPGTGIGLATARRIVRRHGGDMWAEGVAGQGAAFYFTL